MTIFLQLRYLQTLNNIAAENNSTVVFPVPMDLFTKLVEVIPDTSGDYSGELIICNELPLDTENPDSSRSNKNSSMA